jgi:hypothetical protein
MLVESLVKATVELQGFRVMRVTGDVAGLTTTMLPSWSIATPLGAASGAPSANSDTSPATVTFQS